MKFTGERFILGKAGGGIETEHLHRYYSLLELSSGKTILDAACGEGFGSSILANSAKHVWGIDISDEAIAYAKENYQKSNLNYKQGSIEKLDFEDNCFDIVVSFETIEHVEENIQKKFLNEIRRVLKKDGILVMSTPDKYLHTDLPNHKNPFHVKEFYFNEFELFLKECFSYVELFNQTIDNYGLIINYDKKNRKDIKMINDQQNDVFGKYIIAVCSNAPISNKNLLNSIFKAKKEKEEEIILDGDYLQVYWEDNQNFVEYNSVKKAFDYSDEFQLLSLQLPSDALGRLRIDVGSRPSLIQIKKEMILKYKERVQVETINIYNHDGIILLNENEDEDSINLISMSNDPQIVLNNSIVESDEGISLYLQVKVLEFTFDACFEVLSSYFNHKEKKSE